VVDYYSGVLTPIVTRQKGKPKKFLLLDGNIRIEILKDLGIDEVICLVAIDDEAFTYNKRINRLVLSSGSSDAYNQAANGLPL